MDWVTIERFISTGQAFLPVNVKDCGDCVQLIFAENDTLILHLQSKTFLNHLLSFFGAELASMRNRYGKVIGKKQRIPLPLSTGWTLIPFNTRQGIGRQERIGWIVGQYIEGVDDEGAGQASISLPARTIQVFHSKQFCLQQIRSARLVEAEFADIHRSLPEIKEPSRAYRIY